MGMYGLGGAVAFQAALEKISTHGEEDLHRMKSLSNQPGYEKSPRLYKPAEMLDLCKLPRSTFRSYVENGKIQLDGYGIVDGKPEIFKKKGYTLEEIYSIRNQIDKGFWGGKPSPLNRNAFVLSVSMFKGGVGKTTQSTNLAAKAAISGLSTLIIDCDYQASATLALGFVPGLDISDDKNIYEALLHDPEKIEEAIVRTHIHNLHLILASLALSGANVELLNPTLKNNQVLGNPISRLKQAVDQIRDKYDLIILDCPPNFEAVAMNAIVASDGFLLPITPNMLSLASTISFCQTVSDLYSSMINANQGDQLENRLFRVLITNDPQNAESEKVYHEIKRLFGPYLMKHSMPTSIALDRASNDLSILYDLNRSEVSGDKKAFDRALNSMDLINEEIFTALRAIWGIEQ